MAITILNNQPSSIINSNSINLVFGAGVTAGSVAFALFACSDRFTGFSSMSGLSATWTFVDGVANDGLNPNIWLYRGDGVSAGQTSVTVNFNNTTDLGLTIIEAAGLSPTTDKHGTGSGSSASAVGPSLVTTFGSDLLLQMAAATGNPSATLGGGGWAEFANVGGGSSQLLRIAAAYQIVSVTGTYSASWTLGASSPWKTIGGAFQAVPPPLFGPPMSSLVVPVISVQSW